MKPLHAARGAWNGDEFTQRSPSTVTRIWFQVDVPHIGATFDAVQTDPADPHTWNVSVQADGPPRHVEGVKVTDPNDIIGTVLQLLIAHRGE